MQPFKTNVSTITDQLYIVLRKSISMHVATAIYIHVHRRWSHNLSDPLVDIIINSRRLCTQNTAHSFHNIFIHSLSMFFPDYTIFTHPTHQKYDVLMQNRHCEIHYLHSQMQCWHSSPIGEIDFHFAVHQ